MLDDLDSSKVITRVLTRGRERQESERKCGSRGWGDATANKKTRIKSRNSFLLESSEGTNPTDTLIIVL